MFKTLLEVSNGFEPGVAGVLYYYSKYLQKWYGYFLIFLYLRMLR